MEGFAVGRSITAADLAGDPHPHFDRLRAHEPVSWIPDLGCWLVTKRELVLAILRDPTRYTVQDERFSTGRVVGASMLTLDGTEHQRHRRPFIDPFRARHVLVAHQPSIVDSAVELIAQIEPEGAAELRTAVALPMATRTIAEFLGLAATEPAELAEWYRLIVDGVNRVSAGESVPREASDAVEELRARVHRTLGNGPPNGSADEHAGLLGMVAATSDLTEQEIFGNVAVVLFGAIETTEAMIANALHHLLTHPQSMAMVRSDPSLIDQAIEESLRLEPAAAVVDRYATSAIRSSIAGTLNPISPGEPVRLSLSAANRDPSTFENPHEFDIERENANAHLAFVQGPHTCIGAHLARAQTGAVVGAVLGLPETIAIDTERSAPPTGLIFRKPDRLTATW